MKRLLMFFLFCGLLSEFQCAPKEDIVFKGVRNMAIEVDGSNPILRADAYFNNPNDLRMKLKEINVDVLVDGKRSAQVQQKLKIVIPAQADFSVPIEARLSLKELGLLDALANLLGGKKYTIQYIGFIRVAVHGVTIKVPVKHQEEFRIKL